MLSPGSEGRLDGTGAMNHLIEERRGTERLTLRCPAELTRYGMAGVLRSGTLNISSRGLYCVSAVPFGPGERLLCRVEMSPEGFRCGDSPVWLECVLEVVRVERRQEGYGLGCRITEYVLRPARGSRMCGVERAAVEA